MPIPSLCLDPWLRQFIEAFAGCWSRPQKRHFVTVLLGLLQCQEAHTLTGLRRRVADTASLAASPWTTRSRSLPRSRRWLASSSK